MHYCLLENYCRNQKGKYDKIIFCILFPQQSQQMLFNPFSPDFIICQKTEYTKCTLNISIWQMFLFSYMVGIYGKSYEMYEWFIEKIFKMTHIFFQISYY